MPASFTDKTFFMSFKNCRANKNSTGTCWIAFCSTTHHRQTCQPNSNARPVRAAADLGLRSLAQLGTLAPGGLVEAGLPPRGIKPMMRNKGHFLLIMIRGALV